MSDPREAGFNYAKGWGSAPKPPIYLAAAKLTRQLNQESALISARAWALELALWRVRMATTGVEKAVAVAELAAEVKKFAASAQ
jgi:hypothetical protein